MRFRSDEMEMGWDGEGEEIPRKKLNSLGSVG